MLAKIIDVPQIGKSYLSKDRDVAAIVVMLTEADASDDILVIYTTGSVSSTTGLRVEEFWKSFEKCQ